MHWAEWSKPLLVYCRLFDWFVCLSLCRDESDAGVLKTGYDFLEACLRHKSEMVIYEAAKAICNLPAVTPK